MTREEMDAIRQLAGCFNEFRVEVAQRLSVLETNNTDTKRAVDALGAKMDSFNARLSAGSERFVTIFNRIATLETDVSEHEKDSRAKLWQVFLMIASPLVAAGIIILRDRGGH